ncbi:MAG: hypothetical protein J0J01_04700 [Reyranella sp.]|uniref:hypothetical protein n=1 Tax=Reyranella sp. TaxID=1929291 RepID=UPI001AD52F73|nr:hypothetical protein [Reyranella sp.]MBN9086189.1 hypothetical protein [Reyranella sp.]
MALFAGAVPAAAQAQFDDFPTGFLRPATGGMPPDAWNGTSLATAKRLVSALSPAPRSRALRDLQFKVLVSELVTPGGDGGPPPALFARKVDKLAAMGEGESLNEMVRAAGGYEDPAIAAATVNALMMAGERGGACAIAASHPMTEPFGRRATAACQGGSDGAVSTAVLDGPALAMVGASGARLPASALQSSQPPMMRALVANKALPLQTRIEVAERGEAGAIIEATRLSDLYVQAVRENVPLPGPMARRAQLVAAVSNATTGPEIVQSIAAVYAETRNSPLFPTIARATAAGLLRLSPQPQFANVAQEAIRGFLLLGDKKLTEAWVKLAVDNALNKNDPVTIAALDHLMPLVAVAGIDNPRSLPVETVNRWYGVLRRDDPARAPWRGNLLLELFRATGIDVPAGTTPLPEQPTGVRLVAPPAATLQALQAAASGRRRAETALLAALALGELPLESLHPAAVGTIVRSLRIVGEDESARQFAIEVAIAAGL